MVRFETYTKLTTRKFASQIAQNWWDYNRARYGDANRKGKNIHYMDKAPYKVSVVELAARLLSEAGQMEAET